MGSDTFFCLAGIHTNRILRKRKEEKEKKKKKTRLTLDCLKEIHCQRHTK
jgi:hypothetical protein